MNLVQQMKICMTNQRMSNLEHYMTRTLIISNPLNKGRHIDEKYVLRHAQIDLQNMETNFAN